MDTHNRMSNKRTLAVACAWALALSQSLAQAVPRDTVEARPKINLFPTSVVENLSDTSRAARDMESGMLRNFKNIIGRSGLTDWEFNMIHGIITQLEDHVKKE